MYGFVDAEKMIEDTNNMKVVSEAIMIDGIVKYIKSHICKDVSKTIHAHWVLSGYSRDANIMYITCSNCNVEQTVWKWQFDRCLYCPYCGAKMDNG